MQVQNYTFQEEALRLTVKAVLSISHALHGINIPKTAIDYFQGIKMTEEKNLLDELLSETTQSNKDVNSKIKPDIIKPLSDEISLIQDSSVRDFVSVCLSSIDSAFWSAPMPSDGQERPSDEKLLGGIVLHTKRVTRIVSLMCEAQERSFFERDLMLAAAILHDTTKAITNGEEFIYDSMHAYTLDSFALAQSDILELEFIHQILRLVRTHLGVWSPIPETIPVTSLEWSLHLADYISSKMDWVLHGEVS